MDVAELKSRHKDICYNINSKRIKNALTLLKGLVDESEFGDYQRQWEKHNETYANIIKYSAMGIVDPQRQEIYYKLIITILELSDLAVQKILTKTASQETYRLKHKLQKETELSKDEASRIIENLAFSQELSEILKDSVISSHDQEDPDSRQNLLVRVFNIIWLSDKFHEGNIFLVREIIELDFPWYEKCIFVSALTLSLQRCFDPAKIELLYEFYEHGEEQVSQRALVGLLVGLSLYNDRLNYYPELMKKIEQVTDEEKLISDIENAIIQFVKSRETEKITRKFTEEIVPEVIKITPKLKDKLDLDNILSEDLSEDKNPEWEKFFEDSPGIYDKLEEFSRMQMEGSDVFLSAFAMLKHFDFFREMTNWFKPFHKDEETVKQSLTGQTVNIDTGHFIDGIDKSAFLCNSDKYSFCLNVRQMPEAQKTMMLEMFNAELEAMKEIAEEENIINQAEKNKRIFIQYIQDLYRFYKLYPYKIEFDDIFDRDLKIHETTYFSAVAKDKKTLWNIAQCYFERDFFEEARDIYIKLNEEGDTSYEVFEKIAYCNQRMGDFKGALDYYIKAELFDTNRKWLLQKIAYCYRRLKDNNNAVKYYLQAEKLEPENIFLQVSIGNCYLDLEDYKNALNYYYKVELQDPSNHKVLRPLGWTSFILGKLDVAKKYMTKLLEQEANKFDLMNMGHIEWCLGNKEEAIQFYKKSIEKKDNSFDLFINGFKDDKKYLLKNGVDEEDIPLMMDYLQYKLENGR